jgi:hypothetical protein
MSRIPILAEYVGNIRILASGCRILATSYMTAKKIP